MCCLPVQVHTAMPSIHQYRGRAGTAALSTPSLESHEHCLEMSSPTHTSSKPVLTDRYEAYRMCSELLAQYEEMADSPMTVP